jgi:hypothetical protein
LKKRETTRKLDTKPSLPLKSYVGTYEEPAYGRAEVKLDGEKLMVKWGNYKWRLDHYHFDTFTGVVVEPADEVATLDRTYYDVQFRLGSNGAVDGVKFLEQDFTKKK